MVLAARALAKEARRMSLDVGGERSARARSIAICAPSDLQAAAAG